MSKVDRSAGQRRIGVATAKIAFGETVLWRSNRVSPALPAIANGTAMPRPVLRGDEAGYRTGDVVFVAMIDGLGSRDLHALAAGPLMDPNRLYLPAGRLSMAATLARERATVTAAGVEGEAA